MALIEVNQSNYKEHFNGKTLVDCYATWCGPCKALMPILEAVSNERTVLKLDIDVNPELTMEYGIRSVPTVLVFSESGELLQKIPGVKTKDFYLGL